MISRIVIKNFRRLRDLEFKPVQGMNIVVGNNEAGKSTLLEAISLVLNGRLFGRWAGDEINPYWFNRDCVQQFFSSVALDPNTEPPRILVEVYFGKNEQPQELRGRNNTFGEDCPGLSLSVELDPDYSAEFAQYVGNNDRPPVLPTEYFSVKWTSFAGEILWRRPRGLRVAFIDGRTTRSTSGIDQHTRQMLSDFIEKREGANLSVAYRNARHIITRDALADVNDRIKNATKPLMDHEVGLQMDQSPTAAWENAVVPQVSDLPFAMAGQGQQVMIKTALALQATADSTSYVLVEEPENHLSHTGLTKVVSSINQLASGRQTFVVTHSSYVLNRLGLDRLHLMFEGDITHFDEISDETVRYFRLQSGFNTLRLVLARKVVIVEGPSDEMIFNRAYSDITGHAPLDDEIDVITQGIQNRRGLELCRALGRPAAVLRDVDAQTPAYWRNLAKEHLLEGVREMFIGEPACGKTLEPQIIAANKDNLDRLRAIVACPEGENLAEHMESLKTEVAWRIATTEEQIRYPSYITDAINFIRAA